MSFLARRRPVIAVAVAALASSLALAGCSDASGDSASGYPKRSIQVTVPYAPGGGTDIAARAMTDALEKEVGKAVVVVNQEGGGGTVGVAKSASAKPDGYQLGVAIDSNLTLQPSLIKDVGFSLDDFTSFGFGGIPFVLVAKADAPYDDLNGLVDAAKAKPGDIRVSTPGDGSSNDMAARAFALASGTDLTNVGFSGGGADAVNAVLSGEVELASTTIPVVKGLVEGGKLKVVGVLGDEAAIGTDAQTMADAGLDTSLVLGSEIYLNAPKGVPASVVDTLEDKLRAVTEDPAYVKSSEALGYDVSFRDSDDARAELERRAKIYDELLAKSPELKQG